MSSPIVGVAGLGRLLDDPGRHVVVLQVHWADLAPSVAAVAEPGAIQVELAQDLAAPAVPDGPRMPLPAERELSASLRRWGVRPDSTVIVADDLDSRVAARAWWVLRHAGLADVRLLDGGMSAWRAVGRPLPGAGAGDGTAVARFGAMPTVDASRVGQFARDGVLIDARATTRYTGEHEPVDARAGHIPGATSAPAVDMVPNGMLLGEADLSGRFAALGVAPGTTVAVYCGSGVAAALQVLALQISGVEAAMYLGSWSEWAARAELPIATGAFPGAPSPLL